MSSILNKNIIWFVFVFAYCVLSHSAVPMDGQCTVSSCAVSLSGSEESLQFSLDEHDHRLETMNQNMCSALEKLEKVVNRTNARDQEELCQDLRMLYYNMSVNLDSLSEKIPERFECNSTQEQEDQLMFLNLSLTSMTVKTEERIQAVNESLSSILQTINRGLDDKFQTMNETLTAAIGKISEKLNAILDLANENLQYSRSQAVLDHCRSTSVVCDCSDIKANGYTTSGAYRIYVVDQGQRYYANASCDMTTTNGPWTVFQRRKDGSVDFYREWNEYANGFGNPSGEFWLGNNFIHLLTSKRRYRLRIDLEDFEGGKRYAEFLTFNISSSVDKYRLGIGTYSGNAGGDSLSHFNGQRFSTKDNDNDADASNNCAVLYRGAWWYHNYGCYQSNLNGLYLRGNYSSNGSFNGYEGVRWGEWYSQWYSLKTTVMKISSS